MTTLSLIHQAVAALEARLFVNPFLVVNEAEFQALLQVELLKVFPEEVELSLGPKVVDRRPGQFLKARRVYRESKIRPGQVGQEPDLIILRNAPQVILAKENGAPSRFLCSYDAIIETKMDASPSQVFSGNCGKALSRRVIENDLGKWQVPNESPLVLSIIYTANPDWYSGWPQTISVRRAVAQTSPKEPSHSAVNEAICAYPDAVSSIHREFLEHPFRYLREKDFETQLFIRMRDRITIGPDEIHPVRCQWWSEHKAVLGRKRRHDLVILTGRTGDLALEVELKTSHSDQHNWYRTRALTGEFEAMQKLKSAGSLKRAVFLMFRFGPERWQSDAEALCARFPSVEFDCRCSELSA